jgi:hypothetical protein
MRPRALTAAAVAVMGLAMAGCDEALTDFTGPTPNLRPTFSTIQNDIFNQRDSTGRPACTQCHNAFGRLFNGLDLTGPTAYASLVNARSLGKPGATRVVPGDPDSSYLIHKLEGRSDIVGVRMPNGGPYLSAGQILIIRTWIERGAQND